MPGDEMGARGRLDSKMGRDSAGYRSGTARLSRPGRAQTPVPGVDAGAARDELDRVLSRVEADESRASYYARRLLTYFRDRAGVSPLARPGDPVSEYGELRDKANIAVHDELAPAEVAALLSRTVEWFVRVFTPPDEVAAAIRTLAAQPWRGQEQVADLERLATNDHHLRLFFSVVTDPAWLEPVHQADVAQVPSRNAPWPVAALLDGLGKTSPESVAALLERLLADTAAIAQDERAAARFELLRVAGQLGPPAQGVVVEVVRLHGELRHVRSLGVHTALKAAAADSVAGSRPAMTSDLSVRRVAAETGKYPSTSANRVMGGQSRSPTSRR